MDSRIEAIIQKYVADTWAEPRVITEAIQQVAKVFAEVLEGRRMHQQAMANTFNGRDQKEQQQRAQANANEAERCKELILRAAGLEQ